VIKLGFDYCEISVLCKPTTGAQFLVTTEIHLPPGAMLSWYRVSSAGSADLLEQQAAAEAVSRMKAMRERQLAPTPLTT
jgi:hypothetical protein